MTDEVTVFLDDRLPGLLRVLQTSDVRDLEIEQGTVRLRLHRSPGLPLAAAPQSAAPPVAEQVDEPVSMLITAPLVGTFYRAGQPGMPPLAGEGSAVDDGTVVGIVEALSVLTEVEAGCRGVIDEVHATDGQPVEYGQPLFRVRRGE